MSEKSLKAAIQKARSKNAPAAPENMTLLLKQVAKELLTEHMDTLQEDIAEYAAEVKVKIAADAAKAFSDFIQSNWEQMRGAPGLPGETPKIDTIAIARHAATLVPEVDHDEIAHKVAGMLAPQKIDEDALAKKAAALVPVNTPMSIEEMLEKIHAAGIDMKAVKGLPQMLRAIQRNKRESSGEMIHGGGMTLRAGSNVTLTRNHDGTYTVAAAGASGLTALDPTETPNGVLAVFTFAAATAKPSYIVSDNVFMKAVSKSGTVNWTWNAGLKQATMAVPPQDDIEGIV